MNEAFEAIDLKSSTLDFQKIWSEFSISWHFWKHIRTAASILSLGVAAMSLSSSNQQIRQAQ